MESLQAQIIQFQSNQQLNMLINKLIHRLAFPARGLNLIQPVYFFAGQQAQGGSKAKGKAAKKVVTQTPQEKARQAKLAAQAKKQQQEDLKNSVFSIKTSAGNLYRKIIRGINVSKKTNRANFTQQSLRQIIDISTRKDIRLMYEAYYNFIGHFTPVSNQVVDALLHKTMSLATKTQQVEEENTARVFQILQNHEYLGYFPHYSITLKAGQFAIKANKFPLFLDVLRYKPLIKLNADVVKGLYQLSTNWSDFIKLSKILAYRANKEILVNLTNDQLLEMICSGIKKAEKIQITSSTSSQYIEFLQKFDKTNRNVAIAWLVNYHSSTQIAEILQSIPKDDPFIKEFVGLVGKIEEGKLAKVKQHLEGKLAESQHKDIFK